MIWKLFAQLLLWFLQGFLPTKQTFQQSNIYKQNYEGSVIIITWKWEMISNYKKTTMRRYTCICRISEHLQDATFMWHWDSFYWCRWLVWIFCDIHRNDEHAPLKTRLCCLKKPPFMNKAFHKAIMNKPRLKHQFNKYPTHQNLEKYRIQCHLTTKIKWKSVRTYFSKRCEKDLDPWELDVLGLLSVEGSCREFDCCHSSYMHT